MNTRGVNHVEIIISLVIFVGFLGFLFFIINPFESSKKNIDYTNSIKKSLIENLKADLSQVSLKINGVAGCYEIEIEDSGGVFVTDNEGAKISSRRSNLNTNKIYIDGSGGKDFFNILISPDIDNGNFVCSNPSEDYDLGFIRNVNAISYNKLQDFKTIYETDYDGAKRIIGLSKRDDFGFILSYPDGEKEESLLKDPSEELNVNVQQESVKVLYYDETDKKWYVHNMILKVYIY